VIRVGLVDDQELMRAGLAALIALQPDMQVVGQASDGLAAVQMFAGDVADVILMDCRMPVMDGPNAAAELAVSAPQTRIIMLTAWDIDDYVVAGIRAGAAGFLLKDTPMDQLLEAIRRVADGDAAMGPEATKRLMSWVANDNHFNNRPPGQNEYPADPHSMSSQAVPAAVPTAAATGSDGIGGIGSPQQQRELASLTDREREVLVQIADGKSNAEIAAELFVSEATVKTHVSRVLAKVNARDRVQAVIFAYDVGLVKP